MYNLTKKNLIGKGMFSKVYDIGNDKVLVLTQDPSKECLGLFCQGPHIPEMVRAENIDGQQVWIMPRYEKLRAKHKKAWKEFKLVKDCLESVPYECRNGRDAINCYIETVEAYEGMPEPLKDALVTILSNMGNYSDEIFLDLFPRNAMVGKNGELILLDIIGDSKELSKAWERKRMKARKCVYF